jgi:cytochrome c-type biogenesis protein CcmE
VVLPRFRPPGSGGVILTFWGAFVKNYLKFGGLVAAILGVLGWLAASGVSDSKTYYKTIPELAAMGSHAKGQRVRVGGDVVPGSIVRDGAEVRFTLHQNAQQLKVVYRGADPLPDTFRDGSQALADGRLGPNGVFEATKVQAKCASKYEAKPPQNKNALQNRAAL